MNGGSYQRATRRRAAVIEHTGGDESIGYVLSPIGMSLPETLAQAAAFLPFETEDGAMTYIAMASIKRVTPRDGGAAADDAAAREAAEEDARRRAARAQEAADAAEADSRPRDDVEAARMRQQRRAGPHAEAPRPDVSNEPRAFTEDVISRRPDILRHLELLDLHRSASWPQIQTAYRRLAKQHHPDRLRGMGASQGEIEEAAAMLLDLNDAYRALSQYCAAAA